MRTNREGSPNKFYALADQAFKKADALAAGPRSGAAPELLINTKGDVEAACRTEQRFGGDDDYLAYALHHIQAAISKRDDAPCSSMEHAKSAQVALQLERRPTYRDVVAQWEREHESQVAAPLPHTEQP
jgi:hypothetical protein